MCGLKMSCSGFVVIAILPIANNPPPLAVEVFKIVSGDAAVTGVRLVDGVSGTKAFALHLTLQNKTAPLIIVPTRMQTQTTWHGHCRDVLFNTEPKAYRMWRQVRVKTSHQPGPEGQR